MFWGKNWMDASNPLNDPITAILVFVMAVLVGILIVSIILVKLPDILLFDINVFAFLFNLIF